MTEELRIVQRVTSGDVDSFRLLVERYQKPVISMIRNITNDSHTCEDIAQDVLFTAYQKLASFDPARSEFSTWLFTIARNKSLNFLKKKRPASLAKLMQKSDTHNPADELVRKEFFAQLDKALQTLPPRQKIAFVLAELEELPYQKIAQIEGVRIGTVKSRINRAKKKLATALKTIRGST